MNLLVTLRHQQRTRARTMLGLLVVVWLNLALQACASAAPANDMPADRTAVTNSLDLRVGQLSGTRAVILNNVPGVVVMAGPRADITQKVLDAMNAGS